MNASNINSQRQVWCGGLSVVKRGSYTKPDFNCIKSDQLAVGLLLSVSFTVGRVFFCMYGMQ